MNILIAIHHKPGSFSDRWIEYCIQHKIQYWEVNCFNPNIIRKLNKCNALLWHWFSYEYDSQLVARQIIASIENLGIKVFPNIATCWHYDDKIGQKYLLESINAPVIQTWVFFHRSEAIKWINTVEFPKVFKLRCGAGSNNVKLIKNKTEAIKFCGTAFSKGFISSEGYFMDAKVKIKKIRTIDVLLKKVFNLPGAIRDTLIQKRYLQKQKGYIYFQDFLPNNSFDTRITVIGNRAFGFTRNVRPNDFRASGSGDINYDTGNIDIRCVKIAFEVAQKLKTQSLAFDFIFDTNNEAKIGEISYCYDSRAVHNCSGHWNDKLIWHEGHMWPEDAILFDLLESISQKNN